MSKIVSMGTKVLVPDLLVIITTIICIVTIIVFFQWICKLLSFWTVFWIRCNAFVKDQFKNKNCGCWRVQCLYLPLYNFRLNIFIQDLWGHVWEGQMKLRVKCWLSWTAIVNAIRTGWNHSWRGLKRWFKFCSSIFDNSLFT